MVGGYLLPISSNFHLIEEFMPKGGVLTAKSRQFLIDDIFTNLKTGK